VGAKRRTGVRWGEPKKSSLLKPMPREVFDIRPFLIGPAETAELIQPCEGTFTDVT